METPNEAIHTVHPNIADRRGARLFNDKTIPTRQKKDTPGSFAKVPHTDENRTDEDENQFLSGQGKATRQILAEANAYGANIHVKRRPTYLRFEFRTLLDPASA